MRATTLFLALATSTSFHAAAMAATADDDQRDDILVVAPKQTERVEDTRSTRVSIDEDRIAKTVNAASVEDTIKYLPSLVVRKRHIGDNFAPIATRTSGLGSSARSLIYADGAILSALIANNNGNGSPRWSLVTPAEIASVDVLYGPFSAAYSGNSIGTVVNITTRMPETLEARVSALVNVQDFSLYGTDRTLATWQISGSVGNRFGPLALFASATRTDARSQPLSIITAASAPAGTSGSYADLNKTGAAVRVLGAGGLEHHVQETYKLKAALDVGSATQLSYVLGIWRDDTTSNVETYLRDANGPNYTSAFASGIYARDALHWSHVLSAQGTADRLQWQLVGTLYDYGHDIQRTPNIAPPAAYAGGAGNVVRQDGTGWVTLDGKGAWQAGDHGLSFGAHVDRYTLASNRYATADWTGEAQGARNQASAGKTQTLALWAQDAWRLTPELTLTLGGRYEWWRAYEGFNFSTSPTLVVNQPERRAEGLSPKASLEWRLADQWSARLSFGQAWRFPTVGELYQAITTGTVLTSPDPTLRPERARSEELAIEKRNAKGSVRLSLFNEVIDDALISQNGALPGLTGTYTYVQNVERTRARGVEIAIDQRDVLARIDVQASVTLADAKTVRDSAFPAAEGKRLPSVPKWKATAVVTWRPVDRLSLTGAARYASRNYANLDNSDTVGNTWQGFYKYLVVDMRATYRLTDHLDLAVGVDNVNNDRYFLFHPFPQRSYTAQIGWRL